MCGHVDWSWILVLSDQSIAYTAPLYAKQPNDSRRASPQPFVRQNISCTCEIGVNRELGSSRDDETGRVRCRNATYYISTDNTHNESMNVDVPVMVERAIVYCAQANSSFCAIRPPICMLTCVVTTFAFLFWLHQARAYVEQLLPASNQSPKMWGCRRYATIHSESLTEIKY